MAGRPTQIITLAPVTTKGLPAPGWYAKAEDDLAVDCEYTEASDDALSPNIYFCGDTPSYGVACWRSAQKQNMLCLRDPWARRIDVSPLFGAPPGPVAPVRHPSPIGLELSNGLRCYERDGGSWGQPKGHPELYGIYYCAKPGGGKGANTSWTTAVWTTEHGYGIKTSGKVWTVLVGKEDAGPVTTAAVTKAFFVATAT